MIKSLINITDVSCINIVDSEIDLLPILNVNYFETELGSGGFGNVFKIQSINGVQTSKYVLKIISNTQVKDHAYETISLLHTKIKKALIKEKGSVVNHYPELLGLPFLVFKAYDELEEKEVIASVIHNLYENNYQDFGADNFDKSKYIQTGIPERIYYAFQLVKTISFLNKLKFLHSDISENSIWINNKTGQIAIIDYDSGYHIDSQKKPTTVGKIGQWIGSTYRKVLAKEIDSDNLSTTERIDEENWVIANAIFELIFGVTPYFYLVDAEDKTKNNYLKANTWPNIDLTSQYFNDKNRNAYEATISSLNQLKSFGLEKLIEAFTKVFNKGYKSERHRLTANEWEILLADLCLALDLIPEITKFISNKQKINSNEDEVKLEWEYNKGNLVFINNELINSNYCFKKFNDTTEVLLRVVNDFGEATEKIFITAEKVDPVIKSFKSNILLRSDLTPVILSWATEHTKLITISNFKNKFKSIDSIDVNPLEKTKYILKAVGNFNQEVIAEIVIDIIGVNITMFKYQINIEKGIDNIDLYWQTENTTDVRITPRIGLVALNGQTDIGISEKTEFTLTAKGYFNEVSKTIETQPFPIPIIKGILIPTPIINIDMVVPVCNLQIPPILNNNLNIIFNNSISFNHVIPNFTTLEKHIDDIRPIEGKDCKNISPTNLLNNLFKKITNK